MGQETSSAVAMVSPPVVTIPPVPSETYIHHTTLFPRPKLILIGDSITELGSSHAQGWATSLSIRYNRRLDVVNRGMNGYNSRWGMAALPLILEETIGPLTSSSADACNSDMTTCDAPDSHDCVEKDQDPTGDAWQFQNKKRKGNSFKEVRDRLGDDQALDGERDNPRHPQYTFLVAYGANDSCILDGEHSRHHVPLDEYSSNLKQMVRMIRTWNAEKDVSVALLTPPPCDTEMQKRSRNNENITKLYAEACIQVGSKINVPVIDLWNGMQLPIARNSAGDHSEFVDGEKWKADYLSDGLHLTPVGNYRLYELLVEMLERPGGCQEGSVGLGLAVTELPRSYPDHSLVDAKDPNKSFAKLI